MKKKLLAFVMALLLVANLLPLSVLTADAADSAASPSETVYIFFQTVDSAGKALTNSQMDDAARSRLHFDYNETWRDGWATLGTMDSEVAARISASPATGDELSRVYEELKDSGYDKLVQFPGNAKYAKTDFDQSVLDQLTPTDLKRGNGTSGSYDYLTGIWKLDMKLTFYSVQINTNAGEESFSNAPSGGYYIHGETISLPNLHRNGYQLDHWEVTDTDTGNSLATIPSGGSYTVDQRNVTITAQWEEADYNVYVYARTVNTDGDYVYDVHGANYNKNSAQHWITVGKLTTKTEPKANDPDALQAIGSQVRDGSKFERTTKYGNDHLKLEKIKWDELLLSKGAEDFTVIPNGMYWHLDGKITAYQVQFDANANGDLITGTVPDDGYYIEGMEITLPTLERDGYRLIGWKVTDNATGDVLATVPGGETYTTVDANVTLTAQWSSYITPGDTVNYLVEHYVAGANGQYPDTPTETERLGDKIGTTVTATEKSYPGYHLNTSRSTMTGTLKRPEKDADLVILKLYYDADRSADYETPSYYFALQKVDAGNGQALNGATFALYQKDSSGNAINRVINKTSTWSGQDGIALFTVHAAGQWYYAEISAPDGYVKDSNEYAVTVSETTSSKAIDAAESVANFRSATLDMLNTKEHFAYIVGYEDGSIRPNDTLSRAEATTIFYRLLQDSVRNDNRSTANAYADVTDSHWANTAISTMTRLGIVQGCSDDAFGPSAPITRAQFAAICARFDSETSSGLRTFSDIRGHWAQNYIERAAELGWIDGFGDGTFRPDAYITRAQAMAIINRMLGRSPASAGDLLDGMTVWSDCTPDDWFYLSVQEATNSHSCKLSKSDGHETWTALSKNPDWAALEQK